MALELLNKMDKSSIKEKNMSSEEILKALDRFGNGSKTPSPVEEDRGRRAIKLLKSYEITCSSVV